MTRADVRAFVVLALIALGVGLAFSPRWAGVVLIAAGALGAANAILDVRMKS